MGNILILQSKNQKTQQPLQTYQHKNCIQKHKHSTAIYKPKTINKNQDHNTSGIYRLTCNTRKMSYIGQTSRNLNQRYREHIRYIRKNDPQSAYAQNILENLHEQRSITDTMSLLKPIHKMSMLIFYEQLFIQIYHHNGNLITEQGAGEQNPLFQLAIDTMLRSATT